MSNRRYVINEQIKKTISYALCYEMRDPRLQSVTVTRTKVSPDLQYVDIRFTFLDDELGEKTVLGALNRAKGALKKILASKIQLRRVPDLRFHYDQDVASERRIQQILEGLDIPRQENDEA